MPESYSTCPIEEIEYKNFKDMILNKKLEISFHAKDHLSLAQRKVFIDSELFLMLRQDRPRRIYLQKNGRYAIYFRIKKGYRKLILDIQKEKIVIISFFDPINIPKKNEKQ